MSTSHDVVSVSFHQSDMIRSWTLIKLQMLGMCFCGHSSLTADIFCQINWPLLALAQLLFNVDICVYILY
jgi:hypothetical protein